MYAFEGVIIKINQRDFDRWRQSYSAIPDLVAELQKADDYYSVNPPKGGVWFFPVSRWLANENAKHNPGSKQSTRERFANALQSIGGPILRPATTVVIPERQSSGPGILSDERSCCSDDLRD